MEISHQGQQSVTSEASTFTTRQMVANGLVVSKLCYLIEIWGGCEGCLLHSLQVLPEQQGQLLKCQGILSLII